MFKISYRFQKWQKKKKSENVFAFKDNSIWVGAKISLHLEKDTCHWQSMCYETSPRFNISLREIFFQSRSIIVTEKYDESALIHILQGFGTL